MLAWYLQHPLPSCQTSNGGQPVAIRLPVVFAWLCGKQWFVAKHQLQLTGDGGMQLPDSPIKERPVVKYSLSGMPL